MHKIWILFCVIGCLNVYASMRTQNLQLRIAELEHKTKADSDQLSEKEIHERSQLTDYYVLTGRCSDALSLLERTPQLAKHSAYCTCKSEHCSKK